MPRIAEFYGIVISMFYDDHGPPHFHAAYGEYQASFRIGQIGLLEGRMPRRAYSLVVEWTALHQDELAENWRRARRHAALQRIAPLD